MSLSFVYWTSPVSGRIIAARKLAAPEAERLTSTAEPDAEDTSVMSGGAEPAGAAKPHE